VAIPFALMAAGTALQVYGQYQANMAQSQQEFANAEFYKAQADFARAAQFREASIASREYEFRKGAQISAYAKGGVDISGSAAATLADTLASKVEELAAIKRKGELDYSLAIARSRQSEAQGKQLSDFGYNFTQATGTLLGNAAKATDNGTSPALFRGG